MFSDLPPLPEWAPVFGLGILGLAVLLTVFTGFEASLTRHKGRVTGFKVEFKGFTATRRPSPAVASNRREPPPVTRPEEAAKAAKTPDAAVPAAPKAAADKVVVPFKPKKKAAKEDRSDRKRAKRSA